MTNHPQILYKILSKFDTCCYLAGCRILGSEFAFVCSLNIVNMLDNNNNNIEKKNSKVYWKLLLENRDS
ncbi:hypothetical protein OUZ56_033840 [Daphnia magna]|uniref:Uncharacterized protein n=1 Tax=Daphnia magna TaxID=35525 RepID=A0ABR0BBA2_9CRUS|nr:hypothetical protein OUZ56_033840 [Daphnia magna]